MNALDEYYGKPEASSEKKSDEPSLDKVLTINAVNEKVDFKNTPIRNSSSKTRNNHAL